MTLKQLHMIGFSHIDPVWFWDRWEGLQEVRSTFSSLLDRMEESPDLHFTCTSAAFLAFLKEVDLPLFQRVREKILENRIELTGGWWVEPDCNLPCGEALIRQGLYGQEFFHSAFGKCACIGGNVDSFGHNPMLPQLLKGCGMDFYYFMRPRLISPENLSLSSGKSLIRWRSPDGSEVTALSLPGEYTCWFFESIRKNIELTLEQLEGYPSLPCFFGVGNHGGGPTIANILAVRQLQHEFPGVVLSFSTMQQFFNQVMGMKLPVLTAYMEGINTGCYSVDHHFKQSMRKAEATLLRAEKLQAMVSLAGGRIGKKNTDHLWKRLLFCQFHDTLGGTSIRMARDNALADMSGVLAQAEQIAHMAIQLISTRLDTRGDGTPILLINDRAQPWQGIVDMEINWFCKDMLRICDEMGEEIPYQREKTSCTMLWYNLGGRRRVLFHTSIPAFGLRILRAFTQEPERLHELSHEPGELVLDNGFVRAVFNVEGDLCELTDMPNGYQALGSPVRFQIWKDERDSWGHGKPCRSYRDTGAAFMTTEARLISQGELRCAIRVRKVIPWCRLELLYSLDKDSSALELNVRVLWDGPWKSLKLNLCVSACISRTVAEAPYCRMVRKSAETEFFMHRYVDALDESHRGIAVVNDGIYSFSQGETSITLTLLRSAIYAHSDCVGWENEHDTLEYNDLGEHSYRFLFVPHGTPLSPGKLTEMAEDLHAQPLVFVDSHHEGRLRPGKGLSFLQSDQPNIRIGALKTAQDGRGLILRLWETEGNGVEAKIQVGKAAQSFRFRPHEIKTLRIHARKIAECNMLEEEI